MDALLTLLQDASAMTKRTAIVALGLIGDRKATAALVNALQQTDNAALRLPAAEALGRLGDERAVEPLIELLSDIGDATTPGYLVRDMAGEALVQIGSPALLPLLIRVQDRSQPEELRSHVASLLGWLRDDRALAPLTTILHDNTEPARLRRSVATALGYLPSGADALVEQLARRSDEASVRRAAAQAACSFAWQTQVFARLRDLLLDSSEDEQVRATVARWLGLATGSQVVEPLLAALDSESQVVQLGALSGLEHYGDLRALPALERLKHSGDRTIQVSAQRASRAMKTLSWLPLADDEDPAGKLLAQYGPVQVFEPRHRLLADNAPVYILRATVPQGVAHLGEAKLQTLDRQQILVHLQHLQHASQREVEKLTERQNRAHADGRLLSYWHARSDALKQLVDSFKQDRDVIAPQE